MTQYDVTISSKGQLVLPKEIRDKFKLISGSKIKIVVDGEQIILIPRTVEDDLQELIYTSIVKDGKLVNEETVKEYKAKVRKALDKMADEANQEYNEKEYMTLADLEREEENV